MASGQPLTDEDRWPWLDEVTSWIDHHVATGQSGIMTCSALKKAYRDRLRGPGVAFVHLNGTRELLAARLAARRDHYMPGSLLDSQLETLQPLEADESGIVVELGGKSPDQEAEEIIRRLGISAQPSRRRSGLSPPGTGRSGMLPPTETGRPGATVAEPDPSMGMLLGCGRWPRLPGRQCEVQRAGRSRSVADGWRRQSRKIAIGGGAGLLIAVLAVLFGVNPGDILGGTQEADPGSSGGRLHSRSAPAAPTSIPIVTVASSPTPIRFRTTGGGAAGTIG